MGHVKNVARDALTLLTHSRIAIHFMNKVSIFNFLLEVQFREFDSFTDFLLLLSDLNKLNGLLIMVVYFL